jgi:uncharacterized FlaG/YvyC family protein
MSLPESESSVVRSSFERLSKTAISLNAASDRLNQAIEKLNESLKKLNLGISSWVSFYVLEEGPFSEVHEIGYGKINGTWGVGIKKTIEDQTQPQGYQIDETEWQFSEAPRDMRIQAIPHLNKVVEKLNEDADRTTQLIKERTQDTEELAQVIATIIPAPAKKEGLKR